MPPWNMGNPEHGNGQKYDMLRSRITSRMASVKLSTLSSMLSQLRQQPSPRTEGRFPVRQDIPWVL